MGSTARKVAKYSSVVGYLGVKNAEKRRGKRDGGGHDGPHDPSAPEAVGPTPELDDRTPDPASVSEDELRRKRRLTLLGSAASTPGELR